jgi:uncharacterized protein YjdB
VRRARWLLSSLCLLLASCSGTKTSQTGSGGQPSSASLTAVQVTPDAASVSVSATVSLKATGTYSDGTTKDLTSSAQWNSSDPNIASVSAAGVATGVAAGVVTISAHSVSFAGSATLTVNSAGANLTALTLSPTSPSVPVNTTEQLTATGRYSDGSTRDLTAIVTWSSSAASTATVDVNGMVKGVAAGSATITATLNNTSQSVTVTVTAPSIAAISVTPEGLTLPIGISQQFTATAIYSDGSSQDLVSGVSWTSSSTTVATIDGTGLAAILSAGTTTITATVGALSDSTIVTVVPAQLTSITISPATSSIAAGTVQQFTATGVFNDGSTQVLSSAQWSSSAQSVLTVNSTGLATGVGPGTSTLTVTSGTISASASVTVTNATLVSIAIAPLNSSMPVGAAKQFTATGTFSDNTTQDMTQSALWSSSNAAVATINNKGLVISIAAGTTTVNAAWGAITQSTSLTVSTVQLASISITPANPRIVKGTSVKFTATGTYTDGSTATLVNVTWKSSKPQIANVRTSGIAHGKKAGTATISATASGVTGTTTFTVGTGTLLSIVITPANSSVAVGATRQFTATGTFSDGTVQDVTLNSHWSSSVPTVATVANGPNGAGLATTYAPGTTTIGGNSGGITASTSLSAP